MQTSGQVLDQDFSLALTNGFLMICNPFAAPVKLSEFKLTGAPSNKQKSVIEIQMLDDLGVTTGSYKYWKGAVAPHATEGWYSGNNRISGADDAHEVLFAAGKGIWIKAVDGVTATFTCPYKLNSAE